MNLQAMYRNLNKQYFGGELPGDVQVSFSALVPYDTQALSHVHGVGRCVKRFCGENCQRSFILLNPIFEMLDWEQTAEFTVLHEMVHIKALLGDRRYATHGPVFQKEMLRLAAEGAFANRW